MAKNVIKEIRRATRRKFGAEEKIRIVLEGLRGEVPISDVCRREGTKLLESVIDSILDSGGGSSTQPGKIGGKGKGKGRGKNKK